MNVRNLVVAYVLIAAVMWSGGVIPWTEAGVAGEFVNVSGGDVETNDEKIKEIDSSSGVIEQVTESIVGAVAAFFRLIGTIVNFLFYPISILLYVDAPTRVVVLLGIAPTVAFYVAVISTLRG
jgi:hypothetical protein